MALLKAKVRALFGEAGRLSGGTTPEDRGCSRGACFSLQPAPAFDLNLGSQPQTAEQRRKRGSRAEMSPQARRRQRPGPEGGRAGLPWASLVWRVSASPECALEMSHRGFCTQGPRPKPSASSGGSGGRGWEKQGRPLGGNPSGGGGLPWEVPPTEDPIPYSARDVLWSSPLA